MNTEKKKIYIPTNVTTRTVLFEGYGMSELGKTLIFTAIGAVLAFAYYAVRHGLGGTVMIILIASAIGVFLTVKDRTNQSVIDYIQQMIAFAKSQKRYVYNNKIREEVHNAIKEK